MKRLKRIAVAALAGAALTAVLGAGSASATILEVGGASKSEAVAITASLKSGTSLILKDTFGFSNNTCTGSEIKGSTASPYTGATVTGPVSSLTFAGCANPVTVHKAGTLHVAHTSGTNGTVTSSGAEVTTGSPFGTLTCLTGTGTHLGTLTGSAAGHASIAINATLSCSGISSKLEGTYTVTSPTGLGVTDKATSTTILEVGGVSKSEAVAITASLKSGTSLILKDTFGFSNNTCTGSEIKGSTASPYTGATVTGPVSSLTFAGCANPVTVHKAGTLHIAHITGTTNGTVTSSGAEVTTGSPFGTLTCLTGTGTHLGTLTGTVSGHATIAINATLSCSGISSKLEGTYTVTSPTGLGVTDKATSGTTLEVGGVKQNKSVAITATLKAGTSTTLKDTFGLSMNTCAGSEVAAETDSPFSGTTVTGGIGNLAFSDCANAVTVHNGGTLHIAHIKNTTNGTVTSSGTEVTTGSPFGTLNCVTGTGTHLGILTGTVSGHATIAINATLSCSGISSKLEGTYTVTSPTGLGVSA